MMIKAVYQKYIKTSARLEASSAPRTDGVRISIRGDEDQGLVSSEEVWTSPVM